MDRLFILCGALAAFFGVGLGAFGAHGLKAKLSPAFMSAFQTGVQYHLTHALGLIAIGLLVRAYPGALLIKSAGWLMLAGIILFSGSLYLLAITEFKRLGMITPFGGLAFLFAWGCVAVGVFQQH